MNDNFEIKKFENKESSFTELFSLLKRYNNLSDGSTTLAYHSDELKIMHQHIDNAIELLLWGLQDIGQFLNFEKNLKNKKFNNIGFFISKLVNLTEALNSLRSDVEYSLQNRGVVNY